MSRCGSLKPGELLNLFRGVQLGEGLRVRDVVSGYPGSQFPSPFMAIVVFILDVFLYHQHGLIFPRNVFKGDQPKGTATEVRNAPLFNLFTLLLGNYLLLQPLDDALKPSWLTGPRVGYCAGDVVYLFTGNGAWFVFPLGNWFRQAVLFRIKGNTAPLFLAPAGFTGGSKENFLLYCGIRGSLI